MPRHRLEQPRRVAGRHGTVAGSHETVRPRYGRLAAASVSLVVTMVALLGGIGVLPLQAAGRAADQARMSAGTHDGAHGSAAKSGTTSPGTDAAGNPSDSARSANGTPEASSPAADPTALPSASGEGRRVVFSKSTQRVWLVEASGAVVSTYLVSGSLTDNLQPGKYDVYSRSRWAVGVQDSGVMQYFVRFAHGSNAAIGFHSIPTKNGTPLQTEAQLGTPQSHGCIRQRLADAVRMWNFADVGTDVVVVA
jgi:hypothetical protein